MEADDSASKALQEARLEAAMYGKERREQLRRRVRENKVMEEIEKYERGEEYAHSLPALPPPSSPPKGAQPGAGT